QTTVTDPMVESFQNMLRGTVPNRQAQSGRGGRDEFSDFIDEGGQLQRRTAEQTQSSWNDVTKSVGDGFSSVIQNLDGMVSGMAFAMSRLIPTGGGSLGSQIGMMFLQNFVGALAS